MGEGQAVDVALLDFHQAFDTVPHSVLLDKLSNGEMSRCTLRWVKKRPVDIRKPFFTCGTLSCSLPGRHEALPSEVSCHMCLETSATARAT